MLAQVLRDGAPDGPAWTLTRRSLFIPSAALGKPSGLGFVSWVPEVGNRIECAHRVPTDFHQER